MISFSHQGSPFPGTGKVILALRNWHCGTRNDVAQDLSTRGHLDGFSRTTWTGLGSISSQLFQPLHLDFLLALLARQNKINL